MNIIKCAGNTNKLFSNDQHIGSPEVDYKLISYEIARAIELGADIHVGGDAFDCILPKDSKRFQPSAVHKRLRGKNDVIGATIDWAEEIYTPVAHLIRSWGIGNHEETMVKYHGFNPVMELLKRLGCPEAYSGYDSFIKYPKYTIYYHHGTGSGTSIGGAVSEFEKTMKFVDADILWMGHKHHRLYGELRRLKSGRSRYSRVRFIMPGSYMDTYSNSQGSYGEVKKYPPQGKGGIWMKDGGFFYA